MGNQLGAREGEIKHHPSTPPIKVHEKTTLHWSPSSSMTGIHFKWPPPMPLITSSIFAYRVQFTCWFKRGSAIWRCSWNILKGKNGRLPRSPHPRSLRLPLPLLSFSFHRLPGRWMNSLPIYVFQFVLQLRKLKKKLAVFPSPARMSLIKLSLAGNNSIISTL